MISFWSMFSATMWFGIVFLALWMLRRQVGFLMEYGVTVLLVMAILTIVRLSLPLDGDWTIILRSYTLLPAFNKVLRHELAEGFRLEQLLWDVWIAGILIGLGGLALGVLRDRRKLERLPVEPLSPQVRAVAEACGLDKSRVRIAPGVATPMVAGFLHPVIYLPAQDYDEADLQWILKHEAGHIAGGDAWLRLGFLLFRCLFWWNPLVHLSQKLVDDILELRCDKVVLTGTDAAGHLAYVEALYHAASRAGEGISSVVTAGSFVQPRRASILAVRANMAIDEPRPNRWKARVVLILSAALFVASYVFIVQPAELPPGMDDGVEVFQLTPETAYLKRTSSGGYELWCGGEFAGYITEDVRNDEIYRELEVLP